MQIIDNINKTVKEDLQESICRGSKMSVAAACFSMYAYQELKKQLEQVEPHPVKRTEKKYKVFPASSHSLLAAFYAARQSVCFSIGVRTPRLRWTRLVL